MTFTPCARTAWHTHRAGQTLIVTTGIGWVQQWGGHKQAIKPGDVIWTPSGVKHWHGATDTTTMTHAHANRLWPCQMIAPIEKLATLLTGRQHGG
jgi:quercetin dioxygenase-like cupin family protein